MNCLTCPIQQNRDMNSNTKQQTNNSQRLQHTPFCKICKDTGKSVKEYTSHNVRHRGRVVCPVLLATTCRRCNKKGHMASYCNAGQSFKSTRRRSAQREPPAEGGGWKEVNRKAVGKKRQRTTPTADDAVVDTDADVTNKFAGLEVEVIDKQTLAPATPPPPTPKPSPPPPAPSFIRQNSSAVAKPFPEPAEGDDEHLLTREDFPNMTKIKTVAVLPWGQPSSSWGSDDDE